MPKAENPRNPHILPCKPPQLNQKPETQDYQCCVRAAMGWNKRPMILRVYKLGARCMLGNEKDSVGAGLPEMSNFRFRLWGP